MFSLLTLVKLFKYDLTNTLERHENKMPFKGLKSSVHTVVVFVGEVLIIFVRVETSCSLNETPFRTLICCWSFLLGHVNSLRDK